MNDRSPFRSELVSNDFETRFESSDDIKQLKDNPDVIVRQTHLQPDLGQTDHIDSEPIKKRLAKFNKGKLLFEELREKYRINIPSINFVVGEDDQGDKKIFTVTDKIHGRSLYKLEHSNWEISKEEQVKLEQLFANLVQYLSDKYDEQGEYIRGVMGKDEYVYGRRTGEDSDQLYMVDVEPKPSRIDQNDPQSLKLFYRTLNDLARHVGQLWYQNKFDWSKIRPQILVLLNKIIQDHPDALKDSEIQFIMNHMKEQQE